jgi:hypothetical protein
MRLLKYIFLLAVMFSLDQEDVSLRVQTAVPPSHPVRTLATGVVVAEVESNETTGALQTRMLHGDPPFVRAAQDALWHWRFASPPGVIRSRTSITFLFRSPAFYSQEIKKAEEYEAVITNCTGTIDDSGSVLHGF